MLSLENETKHRAGMIALVGRPNVGKSTLVNLLVHHKVSIVSDKAQTTRRRALGVLSEPNFQMVLVDTPGIHTPHTHLGKILNQIAQASLDAVDGICIVCDVHKLPNDEDRAIALVLSNTKWLGRKNVVLCLNKMDLLKPEFVQENVEAYCTLFETENMMLTTLSRGINSDKLQELIVAMLPEGDSLFDEDEFTDQPMRRIAAEIVREKVLLATKQEVPHSVATTVVEWDDSGSSLHLAIDIFVEKPGQKAILIGKQGSMIKQLGTEARAEIEAMIERPIYLELFVKVREDWRQNPRMLRELEFLD